MKPGDIRIFKSKKRVSLVLAIGVWPQECRPGGPIDIHLTGTKKFHTTVTNDPNSKRYHRTLFRNLRNLLMDQQRWQLGDDGAETARN